MLSLTANLSGKEYEQLISICFKFADLFSLTKNGWITPKEEKESTDLMQRLLPYHIETRHTDRWFCYRVPDEQKIETYLFRATPESQKILLTSYNCMFNDGVIWRVPEDLCFFKEGKLVLGSVSHENICYVYDEELAKKLQGCGKWEDIPEEENERIYL